MKNLGNNLGFSAAIASAIVLVGLVALAVNSKPTAIAQGNDEAAVRDALLKSASTFEKNDMAAATHVGKRRVVNRVRERPRELWLGGLSRSSSRAGDEGDAEHEVFVQRHEDSRFR